MKKKIQNQLVRNIFLLATLFYTGCTVAPGQKEFKEAQAEVAATNYSVAIDLFHKITRLYPKEEIALKASREGYSACEKQKGCEYADYFLIKIIESAPTEGEMIEAQKKLALHYYDKGMYAQAIPLMNLLLSKTKFNKERQEVQIKLARSYFYIKNFFQSEVELNIFLKNANQSEEMFEGLLLRADILSAQKKYMDSGAVYKQIRDAHKDLYIKNQVYLSEALMYEDQKMLDLSIQTLESLGDEIPNKEFITMKIERLKERKALMPGASGLKR